MSLASGVEGAGKSLDLNFSSTTTLDGSFVNIADLTSEGDVTLNGSIATTGSQTYNGTATLAGNTTLAGTTLSLASGLEGAGSSLDLNFSTTTALDGSFANLTDLTSEGDVTLSGTIATSGSQTYNGTATLTGNTELTGSTLSLASGVEGAGRSLDLNFSGTTALDGGFVNLTDLTSEGDVTLNGSIATSGSQTYNGSATLAGDTNLTGSKGSFAQGVAGNNHSLTFDFTGTTTAIDGIFGNIQTLTALSDVSLNGTIQTSLDQIYSGSVSLSGATTLIGRSGAFSSGIAGNVKDLLLNFSDTIALDNLVNVRNLQSLGNVAVGGGLLTVGTQTFNGTVSLTANSLFSGITGTFAKEVIGNGHDFTLRFPGAPVELSGNVSGVANLTAETAVVLSGVIDASGAQDYQGAVALSGATNLSGGQVTFATAVTGGQSLVINTTGATTFGSTVGSNVTPLTSLSVVGGGQTNLGGNVTTSGNQSFGGDVNLTASVSLNGFDEVISGTITGNGNNLTFNMQGVTELVGAKLVGVNELAVIGGGTAKISGVIATTGSQNFADNIELVGNTSLQAGNGAITTADISGPSHTLTVGSLNQTGVVSLGGNLTLGALASGSGAFDLALTGSVNNVAGATTLTNTGNVTLGTAATDANRFTGGLSAAAAAKTSVAGTITTAGGQVVLNGTSLTANTNIDATDNGAVPGGAAIDLMNGTALNGFRLDTFAGNSATVLTGATNLSSGVLEAKTGSLNLGTPTAPATITATQNTSILVAPGGTLNLFDGSSVNGGNVSLEIRTDGFQATAGAGNISAGEITIETATPDRDIFLGDVTGSGLVIDQAAFSKLQASEITVGEAGNSGSVDIGNLTVSQGRLDIIANGAGGTVRIDGSLVLNAASAPGGISLLIEGSGATTVLGGMITAANDVVINDALQVDGSSRVIDTTSGNANVTITGGNATSNSGLFATSGQTNSLTITAGTGAVTLGTAEGFGDNNGTDSLIDNVTISAGSTTLGNTSSEVAGTFSVTSGTLSLANNLTAGAIDISTSSATTLAGDVTLAAAGNVGFTGTVDGNQALSVNAGGTTSFGSEVGGTAPLQVLLVANATDLAANVSTVLGQQYGSTTLSGDVTATSLNNLPINFLGTVDGNHALTTETTGQTTFNGTVGGATPLASVTTKGSVAVNGDITTTGSQQFGGTTSLVADAVFASVANGDIDFAGNVTSFAAARALTVNTAGNTTFGGTVSGVTDLTTDAGGTTTLSGDVTTTNNQAYGDDVNLAASVTLTGVGDTFAGNITANGNDLTLNFSDRTTIEGSKVSGLGNLTVTGGGVAELNGAITTAGFQSYVDQVELLGDTVLTGNAASFASGVAGRDKNLTLNFTGATTAIDGGFSNIATLTADSAVTLSGSVQTNDGQVYNGNVALAGDTSLSGKSVAFASGVAGNTKSLALNFSSTTALDGGFSNLTNLSSEGDVTLNGTITTLGSQTYNGTAALNGDTSLSGTSLSLANGVAGNTNSLALNFSGTTALNGLFSNLTNLSSEGNVSLNGTLVTIGTQTYNGTVLLTGSSEIQASAATIRSGVVGGGHDLTINTTSAVTIDNNATVVGVANLAVLGPSQLDATITTSGSQNFAGPVSLLGSTVLSGTSGTFSGGVAGNAKALTLNFTDTTTIDGSSVFSNIGDFTVTGAVNLNGAISTAGLQTYGGAANLFGDTVLNATGGISFGEAVDGGHVLGIEATGAISFGAAIGATTPLQQLNVSAAASVTALGAVAIDGTNGTGPGVRFGAGVNGINMTQPGSTIANANASGVLFAGGSTGSQLGGLTITNSGSHGIEVAAGNYAGTVLENSSVTASAGDGLRASGVAGLTATGIRAAGNSKAGIRVTGASSNVTVSGSIVGLDANGTAAQPNLGQGIIVSAATGTVVENNTVSGNTFYGIIVNDAASNTRVAGNQIGVGVDGSAIGNGQSGVFVLGGATGTTIVGNTIRNNSGMAGIQIVDGSLNTMIGGLTPADANLIASSGEFGITVSGTVTGSKVLRNLVSGHTTSNIYLNGAKGLAIGDASGNGNTLETADYGIYAGGDLSGTTVEGNAISRHLNGGVFLAAGQGIGVLGNTIDDNGEYGVYGTGDLTGSVVQGNSISNQSDGVFVNEGQGLTIGSPLGTTSSDPLGNTITKNTNAGVVVYGSSAESVIILSNQIFENDQTGISLAAGGNSRAVTPSLASASTTNVSGSISGANGQVFRVQYFKSSDAVTTSSRTAQGQELIGWEDVTIAGGSATLSQDISSAGVIVTDWITATATLLDGGVPSETSQFSFGIRVTA